MKRSNTHQYLNTPKVQRKNGFEPVNLQTPGSADDEQLQQLHHEYGSIVSPYFGLVGKPDQKQHVSGIQENKASQNLKGTQQTSTSSQQETRLSDYSAQKLNNLLDSKSKCLRSDQPSIITSSNGKMSLYHDSLERTQGNNSCQQYPNVQVRKSKRELEKLAAEWQVSKLSQKYQLKDDSDFLKLQQQYQELPQGYLGQIFLMKNRNYNEAIKEIEYNQPHIRKSFLDHLNMSGIKNESIEQPQPRKSMNHGKSLQRYSETGYDPTEVTLSSQRSEMNLLTNAPSITVSPIKESKANPTTNAISYLNPKHLTKEGKAQVMYQSQSNLSLKPPLGKTPKGTPKGKPPTINLQAPPQINLPPPVVSPRMAFQKNLFVNTNFKRANSAVVKLQNPKNNMIYTLPKLVKKGFNAIQINGEVKQDNRSKSREDLTNTKKQPLHKKLGWFKRYL